MTRSAMDLSKADLHVFSKLFDDGLKRGQEAKAFSWRQIGGHDDVLDFFVGHLIIVEDDAATSAVIGRWRSRRRLFARRHRRRRTTSSCCAWSAARRAVRRPCRYRT